MNALERIESFEGTQFVIAARELMRCKGHLEDWRAAAERQSGAGRVQSMTKAAVAAQSTTEGWFGADGRIISQAFMASLANRSLLDASLAVAMQIPFGLSRVQLLSGAGAGIAGEVAPKLATRVALTNVGTDYSKVAAMIVLSSELALSDAGSANRLFAVELRNAIIAASNIAFLAALTKTSATAGGTAAESLAAGLAAADDADSYVIAATYSQTRDLAVNRPNGSSMGISGGAYVDGVTVIPVAGLAKMTIVPASRLAIADGGTQVRDSSQALVELDDAPSGGAGAVQVSLWAENLVGIIVERSFKLAGAVTAVEVS